MPGSAGRRVHSEQARESRCGIGGGLAASRRRLDSPAYSRALLGRWHKAVSAILALDQPHARVGQVETDQPRSVDNEPIQQFSPRRYRLIRSMIRNGLPVRMLEGNQRVREDIASNNYAVPASEFKRHVTLRVAWRIDEAQPSDDLIARVHQRDLVLHRRAITARARDETGALDRQSPRRHARIPTRPSLQRS